MQKPGRTRLGPVKLLVQKISIECVDSFVIRFKHTLFGNQHHLDLLPAFQCVVSSISTVVKEYLLVLTNFFPLCCKLASQVGPGAGFVPPTARVVIRTVVLLGLVIFSVPGQEWKDQFLFLCFASLALTWSWTSFHSWMPWNLQEWRGRPQTLPLLACNHLLLPQPRLSIPLYWIILNQMSWNWIDCLTLNWS